MPVDPYGGGYYSDVVYTGDNYPPPPSEGGSIWDIISQGIHEGAQTAQVIGAGYPPGSTVVYSPQYPQGQVVSPSPAPYYPLPVPPGGPILQTPAPGGGVNLSNTTLMLLVGGVLLFVLGSKRGR